MRGSRWIGGSPIYAHFSRCPPPLCVLRPGFMQMRELELDGQRAKNATLTAHLGEIQRRLLTWGLNPKVGAPPTAKPFVLWCFVFVFFVLLWRARRSAFFVLPAVLAILQLTRSLEPFFFFSRCTESVP